MPEIPQDTKACEHPKPHRIDEQGFVWCAHCGAPIIWTEEDIRKIEEAAKKYDEFFERSDNQWIQTLCFWLNAAGCGFNVSIGNYGIGAITALFAIHAAIKSAVSTLRKIKP